MVCNLERANLFLKGEDSFFELIFFRCVRGDSAKVQKHVQMTYCKSVLPPAVQLLLLPRRQLSFVSFSEFFLKFLNGVIGVFAYSENVML